MQDPICGMKESKVVMSALLSVAKGCLGLTLVDGGLEELFHRLPDARFEATKESLVKAYQQKLRSY
jgi:hypothetical protein